jgi:acyl-CoA thioesterase FadM
MTETTTTEAQLQVLLEGPVEESEIDALGHLSVPFYQQRALTASSVLLSGYGLTGAGSSGSGRNAVEVTLIDTFMRNYREQFLGANLAVQGGVLDVEDDRVRCYYELINPERDELSATFVHTFELQETESRQPVAIQAGISGRMSAERVAWPEHGQSRSLDLSQPPFRLDLKQAVERDLASSETRTIEADECTSAGILDPAQFQHLAYSSPPLDDPSSQWVFEAPDGKKLGLADLESRATLLSLPRAGDRIQTFSADVEIARKTFRRTNWVFDLDSAELLTSGSVVMALLDLEARRAIEISDDIRAMFERRYHPDLC